MKLAGEIANTWASGNWPVPRQGWQGDTSALLN